MVKNKPVKSLRHFCLNAIPKFVKVMNNDILKYSSYTLIEKSNIFLTI